MRQTHARHVRLRYLGSKKKKQLFGARDHFGIKPFYYHVNDRQFLFGSEIKSLLAADGMNRLIHTDSLLNYLTFQYVPEPNTMFHGIISFRLRIRLQSRLTEK